ncbi:hypothetical protein HGRIS_011190 [Hohenbuehelia grisea]|uniref:Uncharacterized protein n=1 Tax=Hohenbuehelia grisea TaxID=104357 RepID=A0ABR3JUB2_9AGAR
MDNARARSQEAEAGSSYKDSIYSDEDYASFFDEFAATQPAPRASSPQPTQQQHRVFQHLTARDVQHPGAHLPPPPLASTLLTCKDAGLTLDPTIADTAQGLTGLHPQQASPYEQPPYGLSLLQPTSPQTTTHPDILPFAGSTFSKPQVLTSSALGQLYGGYPRQYWHDFAHVHPYPSSSYQHPPHATETFDTAASLSSSSEAERRLLCFGPLTQYGKRSHPLGEVVYPQPEPEPLLPVPVEHGGTVVSSKFNSGSLADNGTDPQSLRVNTPAPMPVAVPIPVYVQPSPISRQIPLYEQAQAQQKPLRPILLDTGWRQGQQQQQSPGSRVIPSNLVRAAQSESIHYSALIEGQTFTASLPLLASSNSPSGASRRRRHQQSWAHSYLQQRQKTLLDSADVSSIVEVPPARRELRSPAPGLLEYPPDPVEAYLHRAGVMPDFRESAADRS